MEEKIIKLISETVHHFGCELVKASFQGGGRKVLEILIEKSDGQKVTIGDCRNISKHVSALLDVEDAINGKYFLEVSSAGIERPLVTFNDYVKFIGREIKIKLHEAFNGKLTYKGKLLSAENNKIIIQSKNIELSFEYNKIKNANLVLTDQMFRDLLKAK